MNVFDLLMSRGLEVRQSSADDNEYRICCLFCTDMGESPDEKFRCGFNISSGLGHCFNCNWSSRKAILEIVRKLGASDFDLEQVQQTSFTRETRRRSAKVELPDGFELLWKLKRERLAREAWDYVRERGITEEQLEKYEIGIAPYDYRFRDRIIFPVRDSEGKLLGFVGRDYTGKRKPKYLNSQGLKFVYNANSKKYKSGWIVLSEGIFKSLAIERATHGKICSAALLGSGATNTQWAEISDFKEVILFPDPDRAGVRGFLGVASYLVSHMKVSVAFPWPVKQADEMIPAEIRVAILNRRVYSPLLDIQMRLELRS